VGQQNIINTALIIKHISALLIIFKDSPGGTYAIKE
jgi:hypothetical protein